MPGSLLDRMRTGRLSRRRRARVRASFWLSLLELKSTSISTGGEFCPVRLAVAANQKGSTTPQHTPPPGCLPDPSSYMAVASYSVNFRRRWTSLARGGASISHGIAKLSNRVSHQFVVTRGHQGRRMDLTEWIGVPKGLLGRVGESEVGCVGEMGLP